MGKLFSATKSSNARVLKMEYPHFRRNIQMSASDTKGITTSCISCINFIEAGEFCKRFQARPPARVIAFACEEYCDIEEVPF